MLRSWTSPTLATLALASFLAGCGSGGSGSGSAADEGTTDAASATDTSTATPDGDSPSSEDAAPAADAAAHDAGCVLVVDDAGVTHGCGQGGQGPGDRDDGGGQTAPPPDASPDAKNLPFGASCLNNAQCTSDICYDYRAKGQFCTNKCTTNADCPPPPLSPGCNGMGLCRTANGS
jgi:hypothetical protein